MPSSNSSNVNNLPFNIHCFVGADERLALGNSLSIVLRTISGLKHSKDDTNAGMEHSLPVFVSLCSVLLFRYTASLNFKMSIAYSDPLLHSSVQTTEFSVSLTPNASFIELLGDVNRSLTLALDGTVMPKMQDVLYANVNDPDNESPEIVEMSRSGGLYLHFIDIQDCFMTIFSFSSLLSSSYPNAINIRCHWLCLLKGLRTSPVKFTNLKLHEIPILGEEEQNTLLNVWNKCPHPEVNDKIGEKSPLLHNLFERQARLHPDNVAILHEDADCPVKYTYSSASRLAHVVARYINSHQQNNIKSRLSFLTDDEEVFVAHLFPRCAESYIAMLGILKSGAAYVPLDPAFPMERISYILQDCQAKFIITTTGLGIKLKAFLNEQASQGHPIMTKVLLWEEISNHNVTEREESFADGLVSFKTTRISPGKPCYVIYTSGNYKHSPYHLSKPVDDIHVLIYFLYFERNDW
jgi:hypothetical protein